MLLIGLALVFISGCGVGFAVSSAARSLWPRPRHLPGVPAGALAHIDAHYCPLPLAERPTCSVWASEAVEHGLSLHDQWVCGVCGATWRLDTWPHSETLWEWVPAAAAIDPTVTQAETTTGG